MERRKDSFTKLQVSGRAKGSSRDDWGRSHIPAHRAWGRNSVLCWLLARGCPKFPALWASTADCFFQVKGAAESNQRQPFIEPLEVTMIGELSRERAPGYGDPWGSSHSLSGPLIMTYS